MTRHFIGAWIVLADFAWNVLEGRVGVAAALLPLLGLCAWFGCACATSGERWEAHQRRTPRRELVAVGETIVVDKSTARLLRATFPTRPLPKSQAGDANPDRTVTNINASRWRSESDDTDEEPQA